MPSCSPSWLGSRRALYPRAGEAEPPGGVAERGGGSRTTEPSRRGPHGRRSPKGESASPPRFRRPARRGEHSVTEIERYEAAPVIPGGLPQIMEKKTDGGWVRHEDHQTTLREVEAERDLARKFHSAEYNDRKEAERQLPELREVASNFVHQVDPVFIPGDERALSPDRRDFWAGELRRLLTRLNEEPPTKAGVDNGADFPSLLKEPSGYGIHEEGESPD